MRKHRGPMGFDDIIHVMIWIGILVLIMFGGLIQSVISHLFNS